MPNETTSAKDLVAVIRKSPALMISVGAVLLFALYYFYERSKAGAAAASTTTPAAAPSAFAPALGTYTFVEDIHQTPAPTVIVNAPPGPAGPPGKPGPAGPPGPTPKPGPKVATVRTRFSLPASMAYDRQNPGGVPIRSTAAASKVLRLAPFGSHIQLAGGPTSGKSNFPGANTGSTQWLKVTGGGYISSYDLQGGSY